MFESDFRCPWLPRGTRVCLVRTGEKIPETLTRYNGDRQLEGQHGKITCRRRPPMEGYRVELDFGKGVVEMDAQFLEPVIGSVKEAEDLLRRTLEEDGEEA